MKGAVNNQDCAYDPDKHELSCSEYLYSTVTVNGVVWMGENLMVGQTISSAKSANDAVIERYCYDNSEYNCIRGGLYQWHEAMGLSVNCMENECSAAVSAQNHQGICPNGWHIPTGAEWEALVPFSASVPDAVRWGKNRKNTGFYAEWDAGATNETGLGLYPAGYYNTSYASLGVVAFLLTADSEQDATQFSATVVSKSGIAGGPADKTYRVPVRCVKN